MFRYFVGNGNWGKELKEESFSGIFSMKKNLLCYEAGINTYTPQLVNNMG